MNEMIVMEKLIGKLNNPVINNYPELEDLVVNSSTEDQNYNSSKYGFKSVKINAIKGDELDLNPSTEQQYVEGVFTKVKLNAIKTQKLNTVPTTQEQVITGLFDEVTVNAIEGQELNLNPSEEQQNFEGVFLGVNINPIQVQEITADLDFSSGDAIELTPQEGTYIKKTTINKPSNLSPENIKSGETVCGIAGTNADTSDADATSDDIVAGKTAYVANEKIQGTYKPLDTSDATATANDIVEGKTAYVNGKKIVGTLESGYKFLEYIESDGNQYIDTGYIPTTTVSQFELVYSEFTAVGVLFGYYNGSWERGMGIIGNGTDPNQTFWYHCYGNWNTNIKSPLSATLLIDRNVVKVNGTVYTAPTTSYSKYNGTVFLFGANWLSSFNNGAPVRIHKFVIKENNVVLHYFKPVINVSSGEIGMYDVVGGNFFGNQGTGTFIAGPEV